MGDLRLFYSELQMAETSALPLIGVVGKGTVGKDITNAMFLKMISTIFILILWFNFT